MRRINVYYIQEVSWLVYNEITVLVLYTYLQLKGYSNYEVSCFHFHDDFTGNFGTCQLLLVLHYCVTDWMPLSCLILVYWMIQLFSIQVVTMEVLGVLYWWTLHSTQPQWLTTLALLLVLQLVLSVMRAVSIWAKWNHHKWESPSKWWSLVMQEVPLYVARYCWNVCRCLVNWNHETSIYVLWMLPEIFGASYSLSELQTSETAMCMCVYMYVCICVKRAYGKAARKWKWNENWKWKRENGNGKGKKKMHQSLV